MEKVKYQRLKSLLDTNDVSIIKTTAENFVSNEMPDEIVNYFAEKLTSPDNGIKDAVSNTLVENSNPHIPEIIVPLISSKDSAVRNLAGEILLQKKDKSISAILNYLKSCNDEDKKFLIDILGLIGNPVAVDLILKILSENKDDNVILACIEALGNLKEEKAIRSIVTFYDKNELYQPTIIEALGKIGSKEAVDFILKIHADADDLTKFSIIESLGNIGDVRAYEFIKDELKNVKGPLAWVMLDALVKLESKLGLRLEYDSSMKNLLLEILLEGDQKYKLSVVKFKDAFSSEEILHAAIQNFGFNEKIDNELKQIFLKNPDSFLKIVSGNFSSFVQNKKSVLEFIKEILAHDGGESYNRLNPSEKMNLANNIATFLNDPDEEVRIHCIELLFYLNPETALLFLDTMVNDDSVWNKLRLLEIIRTSNEPKIIESIKKLSHDEDEMVRETAHEILIGNDILN